MLERDLGYNVLINNAMITIKKLFLIDIVFASYKIERKINT